MFQSRRIKPSEFVREFFDSLTPGVIPRGQFIDWDQIKAKCAEYTDVTEYLETLRGMKSGQVIADIKGTLLSVDDPFHMLKGAFEILGHTNDYYVSDVDNLDFHDAATAIKKGSEKTAEQCASLLADLGLRNVLQCEDTASSFLGVQVGLESNRRKSVGGKVFNEWVKQLLESTCALLGAEYSVAPEVKIRYKGSDTGKRVDFAIVYRGQVRIGVEVNFYTTSGSKPSEIKRAYENVNRELNRVGVELVWITDGAGYLKMKQSIEEAFSTHPNTYNYEMARRHLKVDILDFLK